MSKGKLYMIPSFLGENNSALLPNQWLNVVEKLKTFFVEDERSARRFLRAAGYKTDFAEVNILVIEKHSEEINLAQFLDVMKAGNDAGIISEAGCPGVADPGADIEKAAHEQGIKVIPLVGPSSILLSLMASGLNGQSFAFVGYLPIDKTDRRGRIQSLEQQSVKLNQTQIFIEAPYRNNQLLADLLQSLNETTILCIACHVTLPDEFIKTQSVKQWKRNPPDLNKKPTVFLLLKNSIK